MSRSTDYLYAPLQSSPRALGIFVLVLGVFGGLALLTGGTLWPIFPIQSRWHLLFWLIAACTPGGRTS